MTIQSTVFSFSLAAAGAFATEVSVDQHALSSGQATISVQATTFRDVQSNQGEPVVYYRASDSASDLERLERINDEAVNSAQHKAAVQALPAAFSF